MNWPELAKQLAVARKLRGLTQQDVADMTGIGTRTISSFESGARTDTIRVRELELIVHACGMTLADLFAGNLPPMRGPRTARQQNADMDVIAHAIARRRGPSAR